MNKEKYFEKIREANLIGEVADIILDAEHDKFLAESEIEEIIDYAEDRIDEIGGA